MEKPKVTIITACYNSARTIERTIQSVLGQTYDNIEYIVVDALSNDGTYDIISKYSAEISRWVREPDDGISDAWNKGIRQATGEIIGIINADDVYLEAAVEKAILTFQTSKEIGFVFGDLIYTDDVGNVLFKRVGDPNYARHIIHDMPSIPHPTVFVRKEVYEKCGLFDVNYKLAMDYELFQRMNKAGIRGSHIEEVLAAMTVGGVSDAGFHKAYKEVAQISIKYGCSPIQAKARLFFKLVKGYARRWLESKGFNSITCLYRTIFHKWYQS